MQHTGLVLALEKSALQAVLAQLLARQAAKTSSSVALSLSAKHSHTLTNTQQAQEEEEGKGVSQRMQQLSAVHFVDFAVALLENMNSVPFERKQEYLRYSASCGFFLQLASIVLAFEAVDVDSRGVIDFHDFTGFCLRLARLLFKPNAKRSLTHFAQRQDQNALSFPCSRMRFVPYCQLLVVFDSDSPRVRVYGRDCKYQGKVNPVLEAKRSLRVKMSQAITYREKVNLNRESVALRAMERELDPSKGSVLDAAFADSTRQLVFSCTHSYLVFVDVSKGLMQENDVLTVVEAIKTANPMHGLYYSAVLDLLLAYPGEGSDHDLEVFDVQARRSRFVLHKHESKILAICECVLDPAHPAKDHYFVTTSIDKKVLMWPSAPISALMRKEDAKKMLRVADTMDFELRGHNHAIHSLVYAPVREVLFGCGFDFDVIGWDPFSRDVCMRFVGHFKSLIGLQVVNIPSEKLLSVDDAGVLKVWNISKELGIFGEQESSTPLQCAQPPRIKDFVKTFDGGRGVAILAEKVHFLSVEGDVVDDMKPIRNGIGVCAIAGRLFTVFRSTIQIFDLVTAAKVKRVAFLDADRIATHDVLISKSDDMKMGSLIPTTANHSNNNNAMNNTMHNTANTGTLSSTALRHTVNNTGTSKPHNKAESKVRGGIDVKDKVSCMATDSKGKKLFLGTHDGRVLLFDSFTFGLLRQLTCESEDSGFLEQGSVVSLFYVDRDELVVAAYANGAVKVFGGCHHGGYTAAHTFTRSTSSHDGERSRDKDSEERNYPRARGGRAPSRPYLLRECDLGVISDLSVRDMAVSPTHSLVAVLTRAGVVYLYDYLTLDFLQCIVLEDDLAPRGATVQFLAIQFLPFLPLFVAMSSEQRVVVWTVKGMDYKHLLSFHLFDDLSFNASNACAFFAGYDDLLTLDDNGRIDATISVKSEGDSESNTEKQQAEKRPLREAEKERESERVSKETEEVKNDDRPEMLKRAEAEIEREKREQAAEEEAALLRFHPRYKAQAKTMRCLAIPSPMESEEYEELRASTLAQSLSQYRWLLLVGNEVGQFFTVNLTELVRASQAVDFVPRLDAQLAVYQKFKPRRFVGLEADADFEPMRSGANSGNGTQRLRLPEDWVHKLQQPLRKGMDGSNKEKTREREETTPSLLTRSPSRRTLHTRTHIKRKPKLDTQSPSLYVQGLYAWIAFSQIAVKGAQLHNPSLHCERDSFLPPADLLYETFPHRNKLPLLFLLSEYGSVRVYSLGGAYLGQTFDEGAEEESTEQTRDANETSDDFLSRVEGVLDEDTLRTQAESRAAAAKREEQSSMFLDESTRVASTTFITSVLSEDSHSSHKHSRSQHSRTRGGRAQEEEEREDVLSSSKIFVRSESRSLVTSRRLSVVPKSAALASHSSEHSARSQNHHTHTHSAHTQNTGPTPLSLTASLSFLRYTRKVPASKGWLLPLATVSLPPLKRNTDEFSVQQTTRLSALQFSYFSLIARWVTPHIDREIDDFFRRKFIYTEEEDAGIAGRGLLGNKRDYERAKLSALRDRALSYRQRFQSEVNMLKKMNSFLIERKQNESRDEEDGEASEKEGEKEQGSKKNNGKKKKKAEKSTEEVLHDLAQKSDPDRLFDKVTSSMSRQELQLVDQLRAQIQSKHDKRNLHPLIEYIQENDAFSAEAKQGESSALTLKNYEREKKRSQRAGCARSVSAEVQEMIEQFKREDAAAMAAKKSKGKKPGLLSSRPSSAINANYNKVEHSPPRDSSISAMALIVTSTAENETKTSIVRPVSAMKKGDREDTRRLTISFASPATENDTHVGVNDNVSVQRDRDQLLSPVLSAPPSPALVPSLSSSFSFSKSASVSLPRPASASAVLPRSALSLSHSASAPAIKRPQSAAPHSSPTVKENEIKRSVSEQRIDNIINHLERIDVEGKRDSEPLQSMAQLINARPSTAPAIIHSEREIDLLCDPDTQKPLSLLGRSHSLEETFSNFPRLTQIADRVDSALAVHSHEEKKNFRPYDPLHKKKMQAALRNRRKLKQKLSFAKDKDKYIDEEDYHTHFEDVVDLERERQKLESKQMLRQAHALQSKDSVYGPYKTSDIIKLLHFLELLTPLDISPQERSLIPYLDDSGIVDLSRFLRDQHYFLVNDVLDVVDKLMSREHPLYQQLLFYRDEAPRFQRLSLYDLIGFVFPRSKAVGVQLRIFLFITAAHLIYDLMRTATPPKEFKANATTGSQKKAVDPKSIATKSKIFSGNAKRPVSAEEDNFLPSTMEERKGPSQSPLPPDPAIKHYSNLFDTPKAVEEDSRLMPFSSTTQDGTSQSELRSEQETMDEKGKSLHDDEKFSSSVLTKSPSRFKSHLQSTIETDRVINEQSTEVFPQHVESQQLEPTPNDRQAMREALQAVVRSFIVTPHPTRGFHNWVVKRQIFQKVTKTFDLWSDENLESLNVNDFVAILHSLVPRAEMENFRVMKMLLISINRIGLKMSTDLTGEILYRIFENVLHVKIVSG